MWETWDTSQLAKRLIELLRIGEDVIDALKGRSVPLADGLVEGLGIVEHLRHVGDRGGIPVTDILVELHLVLEGLPHVGDGRGIPMRDVPVGLDGGSLVGEPEGQSGAEGLVGERRCLWRKLCPFHIPVLI